MLFHLDGREPASRDALHALLAYGLALPSHYGRNLDALFDTIGEKREAVTVEIVHFRALRACLGDYAQRFLETLSDLEAEKPDFHLRLYE
jgi:ribonuclease inhibitor